jgi:PAS domain-containing protein
VVAIKRLRDQQGLRLTDAAAIALAETDSAPDDGPPAPGIESATLQSAWAALLDTVPTLLLVIDENGRVIGANRAARQTLPVRRGSRFETLAPPGWRPILRRISGESNSSRQVNLQLRTSGGTMSMRGVVAGRTPRRNFVILSGSQHPPTPSAGQSASPESSPGIPRPHVPSQP